MGLALIRMGVFCVSVRQDLGAPTVNMYVVMTNLIGVAKFGILEFEGVYVTTMLESRSVY